MTCETKINYSNLCLPLHDFQQTHTERDDFQDVDFFLSYALSWIYLFYLTFIILYRTHHRLLGLFLHGLSCRRWNLLDVGLLRLLSGDLRRCYSNQAALLLARLLVDVRRGVGRLLGNGSWRGTVGRFLLLCSWGNHAAKVQRFAAAITRLQRRVKSY